MKDISENLSVEEQKFRQLIGSLEKVSPPPDFDFRLKARIANANPKTYQARARRPFVYVLSASALALILGLLSFNGNFSGSMQPDNLAQTETRKIEKSESAKPSFANNQTTAANNQEENSKAVASGLERKFPKTTTAPEIVELKAAAKTKIEKRKGNSENNGGGGSRVLAGETEPPILPRGIEPNKKIENPQIVNNGKTFSASEILSQFGIETVSENGNWKVKSIRENSVGARSGVKVDDVIEAIDGETTSPEPMKRKTIEGKKLNVLRGAEKLEIKLQF